MTNFEDNIRRLAGSLAGKKSSVEVTEEEWVKIREGMKPDNVKRNDDIDRLFGWSKIREDFKAYIKLKEKMGGTSMFNELIFSVKCEHNETLADVKRKLANISYVLNNAVDFTVVHVHNEHVFDGVSTVIEVRMTYPTLRVDNMNDLELTNDVEDVVGIKDEFVDILCKQIHELKDRLTSVENESAEHRENIEELDSSGVFGYADEIDGFNKRLNNLDNNHTARIDYLEDAIHKLSERLDDLEDDNDDTDDCSDEGVINCLNTITTRLNNLVKNVDIMRTNSYRDYKALQDVKETVSNLTDRIERLEEDNRELHRNGAFGLDFEGLNQRTNACKNALTDILKDIDVLQKDKACDKSSARYYDLELISKKVMDIDKLDENLAELKKDVNFLRKNGSDTYTALSDLEKTVCALKALKTNVDDDYKTLTTLKDSVQELGTDVSGLMHNYNELGIDVSSLMHNYTDISNRINILEKDLGDIKNNPSNYKSVTVNVFDGETDTDV